MFGMSPGKNCAAHAAGLRDAMDTQGDMGNDRLDHQLLERLLVEVEFLCGQHRYRDRQTLLVKSPPRYETADEWRVVLVTGPKKQAKRRHEAPPLSIH